jgi:hypothetical protein
MPTLTTDQRRTRAALINEMYAADPGAGYMAAIDSGVAAFARSRVPAPRRPPVPQAPEEAIRRGVREALTPAPAPAPRAAAAAPPPPAPPAPPVPLHELSGEAADAAISEGLDAYGAACGLASPLWEGASAAQAPAPPPQAAAPGTPATGDADDAFVDQLGDALGLASPFWGADDA